MYVEANVTAKATRTLQKADFFLIGGDQSGICACTQGDCSLVWSVNFNTTRLCGAGAMPYFWWTVISDQSAVISQQLSGMVVMLNECCHTER